MTNGYTTVDYARNDVLGYLQNRLPGYPYDVEMDRDFVDELLEDFPFLDILDQIKRFRWYYDNQPPMRKIRAGLRRWMALAKSE